MVKELSVKRIQPEVIEVDGKRVEIIAGQIVTTKLNRYERMAVIYFLNGDNKEINRIMNEVAYRFGITVAEMLSRTRKAVIVTARQYAMYRLMRTGHYSSVAIGKIFERDHGTVLSAIKKINNFKDLGIWEKYVSELTRE